MRELQSAVAHWHRAAFPGCEPAELTKKIGEEVAELIHEIGATGYEVQYGNGAPELADVAIALLALADRCQVDLGAEIAERLLDVRKRYPPA